MGPEDTLLFRRILTEQLSALTGKAEGMVSELNSSPTVCADPNDRASIECDTSRDLRIRDRERMLISKIREALNRLNKGSFGVCEICEEPIGKERLMARPVTTLCIECKQNQEEMEKRKKV